MHTKKLFISLVLIFSFLLSSSTFLVYYSVRAQRAEVIIETNNFSYIERSDPFIIIDNGNFSDYGFPGNGSEINPYRIENYNISTIADTGIFIEYTNVNFTIQNCVIEAENYSIYIDYSHNTQNKIVNNTCSNSADTGIFVKKAHNTTIANNTCSNNNYGIYLLNSDDSTIENNTCSYNGYNGIMVETSYFTNVTSNSAFNNTRDGIQVFQGSYSSVKDNFCLDNSWNGVASYFSDWVTIHNNTCERNLQAGFVFSTCTNTNFTLNICMNNRYGFESTSADNIRIEDNTITDSIEYGMKLSVEESLIVNNHITSGLWAGISISDGTNSTFANNTLVGNGMYIEDTLFSFETMEVINNTLDGLKIGYYAKAMDLTLFSSGYAQFIFADCLRMTLQDLSFSLSQASVRLLYCDEFNILNCDFVNNILGTGLSVYSSTDVIVQYCTFQNNKNGLFCRETPYIAVDMCDFIDNYIGLKLENSHNSTISDNFFESNEHVALELDLTNGTLVHWNEFLNNEWISIVIDVSSKNTIKYNLIQETLFYGIVIYLYSTENLIHHNTFSNNNQGGISQAFDDGFNNTWFEESTTQGNYWSDYIPPGSYIIDGSALIFDPFPLLTPPVSIIPEFKNSNWFLILPLLMTVITIPYVFSKRKNKLI